jgi:hypothetical protein
MFPFCSLKLNSIEKDSVPGISEPLVDVRFAGSITGSPGWIRNCIQKRCYLYS